LRETRERSAPPMRATRSSVRLLRPP
jgi:hypothetical protein